MKRRLPLDVVALVALAGLCAAAYWYRPATRRPAPLPAPADADVQIQAAAEAPVLEVEEGDFAGAALNREGVELARAGKFAEAAVRLRAALQASPSNEVVRRNLKAVLTAWAHEELERGQARLAADHLTEALGLGRDAETLTALGIAHLRGRQYGEATAALEEAQRKGSKNPFTYIALADAYEATNDRVRALETLHRTREAGLDTAGLQARIDRLGREVDAEWDFDEESSRNFQVRFDAAQDPRAAAEVLRSLEAAYDVVGRKLGYFPGGPTPVVLYAEQDFHHVTQTPDWAGGVFDGRLKFPVRGLVAGPELDRVTRHEYAHSVIAALALNRVPAWLNEGLAMWAEEESLGDRRDWAEQTMANMPVQPLGALARPFASLPREYVQGAYAQSYLTALFLVEQYDERRISRLLEAMRRSPSLAAAFGDVYPVSLDRFESDVAAVLAGQ